MTPPVTENKEPTGYPYEPFPTDRSKEIDKLLTALSKAQGEFSTVGRDSKNPAFKSEYASLNAYVEAARPVLAKHGLTFMQLVHSPTGEHICLKSVLGHSSGQYWESNVCLKIDPNARNLAHQVGSLLKYLRRYSIGAMLGLADDHDDDGNDAAKLATTNIEAPQPIKTQVKKVKASDTQLKEVMNLADLAGVGLEKICEQLGIDSLPDMLAESVPSVIKRLNITIDQKKEAKE